MGYCAVRPEIVKNSPIYSSIWNRLYEKNKNFLAINIGPTGSGKSWGALRFAYNLDRDYKGDSRFSIDKVVFTPSQFLSLVRKNLPAGSFIVWDEAGVGLASREWYSRVNRFLVKVLQTFRFQQYGVIFTTPALNNIDKQARQLFHALIQFSGKVSEKRGESYAQFRWMEYNGKNNRFYYKNPRAVRNGVLQVIRKVAVKRPPEDFVEEYEERKRKQMGEWYENYEDEMKVMEKMLGEKKGANTLKDWAEKAVEMGLENFVDLDKAEKGERDLSAAAIQAELEVNRSTAYDLKKYLMRQVKQGNVRFQT